MQFLLGEPNTNEIIKSEFEFKCTVDAHYEIQRYHDFIIYEALLFT